MDDGEQLGPPPPTSASESLRREWCDRASLHYIAELAFEGELPEDVRPTHLWEITFQTMAPEEYEAFLRAWFVTRR
jgi:hypothetical protein